MLATTLLLLKAEERRRGRGSASVSQAVSPQFVTLTPASGGNHGQGVWRPLQAAPPGLGAAEGGACAGLHQHPRSPHSQSFRLSGSSGARKEHLLLRERMECRSQTSHSGSEKKK